MDWNKTITQKKYQPQCIAPSKSVLYLRLQGLKPWADRLRVFFSLIEENGNIFDFMLLREEMEQIAGVSKHRLFYQVTAESLKKMATTKCNFEEE